MKTLLPMKITNRFCTIFLPIRGICPVSYTHLDVYKRQIFDGEKLNDLLAPLDLGWKARTRKELALMEDLIPLLKRLAAGHEISGLSAYEE